MYSIDSISEMIEKLEGGINKADYLYSINGDVEAVIKADTEARNYLSHKELFEFIKKSLNCTKSSDEKKVSEYIYNFALKYQGDFELKSSIEKKEMVLRKERKHIEAEEYEERLRELVILRNKFANSLGYSNYLDIQYNLFGLDKVLLDKILNNLSNKIYAKYDCYLENGNKKILSKEYNELKSGNQFKLAKDTLNMIGFNLDELPISFDIDKSESKVRAGCVIPFHIPDKIQVINNPSDGLGAFVCILMHEIGHALYFSNIDSKLEYELRKSYNSVLDDTIALFFEKLILSKEWFNKFLNADYPEFTSKNCAAIPQLICCMNFEKELYKNPYKSFDEIWNVNLEKYYYNSNYHWTKHHFFVSVPGYTSVYLMSEIFSTQLIIYLMQKNKKLLIPETSVFLKENIFKYGRKLDYDYLIKLVNLYDINK